jgi:hypothetical protein
LPGQGSQTSIPQEIPHDIVSLVEYGMFLENWVIVLLSSLVFIVVFYLLFRKFYKKKAKPEVIIDPFVEAIEKLKLVFPHKPYNRKAQEHFYYELSYFLRLALEITKKFRATDLTLKELRQPLQLYLSNEKDFAHKILNFLERAELIKFAEKESSEEESLLAKSQVISWSLALKTKETEGSRYFDSLQKRDV